MLFAPFTRFAAMCVLSVPCVFASRTQISKDDASTGTSANCINEAMRVEIMKLTGDNCHPTDSETQNLAPTVNLYKDAKTDVFDAYDLSKREGCENREKVLEGISALIAATDQNHVTFKKAVESAKAAKATEVAAAKLIQVPAKDDAGHEEAKNQKHQALRAAQKTYTDGRKAAQQAECAANKQPVDKFLKDFGTA